MGYRVSAASAIIGWEIPMHNFHNWSLNKYNKMTRKLTRLLINHNRNFK